MGADSLNLDMQSSDATATFAAALGVILQPGDTVLLTGDVGAGKTHLARHLIQAILLVPEDVPSPTFTIVQTYETANGPLWHADLYRLTDDAEVEELGLSNAFETAICLVEWPDRLGPLRPKDALCIHFEPGQNDESRVLRVTWGAALWRDRLEAIVT